MGNERVKGYATKTNGKRRSLIPGAHPPHAQFSVILRKSGRTCFTENFGYTIYIDKNVNESTTVCSLHLLRSLALNKYISIFICDRIKEKRPYRRFGQN